MNLNDPFFLILLPICAILIFFTFRNGRKRQRDSAELQEKILPGAEVMTNFGLFGTIVSKDDEDNKITLETAPGTVLTLHRQTIVRVITPDDNASGESEEKGVEDQKPLYGERVTEIDEDAKSPRKPVDE